MNETQSPTNPIAEAVRGYMRARAALVEERKSLDRSATGWSGYRNLLTDEMADIDRKVKTLLTIDSICVKPFNPEDHDN